jgi:hypothetical protein
MQLARPNHMLQGSPCCQRISTTIWHWLYKHFHTNSMPCIVQHFKFYSHWELLTVLIPLLSRLTSKHLPQCLDAQRQDRLHGHFPILNLFLLAPREIWQGLPGEKANHPTTQVTTVSVRSRLPGSLSGDGFR